MSQRKLFKNIILSIFFITFFIFSIKNPIFGAALSLIFLFILPIIMNIRLKSFSKLNYFVKFVFDTKLKYSLTLIFFFVVPLLLVFFNRNINRVKYAEVSIVLTIKKHDYIPYTIVNRIKKIRNQKYNSIIIDATAGTEGKYSINKIKETLKVIMKRVKYEESNADYLTVNFFERKIDIENFQSYSLGTVSLKSDESIIKLDSNESFKDKENYKYNYLIRERIESNRPSKLEYKIYDRFYFLSKKYPYLSTIDINKMIQKEFKIGAKENEKIFIKVFSFLNSDIKHILE